MHAKATRHLSMHWRKPKAKDSFVQMEIATCHVSQSDTECNACHGDAPAS